MKTNEGKQMDDILMRDGKRFPNGFRSWMETHHEITTMIACTLSKWDADDDAIEGSETLRLHSEGGTTEMYDYALKLTDKFEAKNEGREWDGEFFEEIEAFFRDKDLIESIPTDMNKALNWWRMEISDDFTDELIRKYGLRKPIKESEVLRVWNAEVNF